jgi:predicted dienelactone hydrolase
MKSAMFVVALGAATWATMIAAPGTGGAIALAAEAYDPLAASGASLPEPLELVVHDADQNRDIPVRVYLPAATTPGTITPAPVVLFSHGLGGARDNNPYLGKHWSARGYVVVFLQHAGSDDSVWRNKPLAERLAALRAAADATNFLHRTKDVPAVLDQLAAWNGESGDPLAGRLDMDHVGMSGHSFGAVTTQAVSGQSFAGQAQPFTDQRIKAAIMFSPSSPRRGTADDAFGAVAIPWLLMTGTEDTAPIGDQTVESRLKVFPALPAGEKYELVLDGAQHSAFGDRALPGDRGERNPNHHRAILAISTAFWDAYLRNDAAAKAWLDGDGPRSVLQDKDRWRRK